MVAPISSIPFDEFWQGLSCVFRRFSEFLGSCEAIKILDSRNSKLSKDKRVGMETGYSKDSLTA